MSYHVTRELVVQDSADSFALTAKPYDEYVDWTDDDEAILAQLQTNRKGGVVLMTRNDLRNLRTFINEILKKDGDL